MGQPSSLVENPRLRTTFTIIAIVPVVFAVVRALTGDWIPTGDDGLLALRVDDVGSAHHPWLGSWTSASLTLGENVNNPGAWYDYLAAPPVAALGPTAGAAIAVGLLNALVIVGIGRAGRLLGGAAAELWLLAGAAALAWAMGSELLIDIWQPHALLLPVLLVMVLACGVAAGRASFLPWMLVVASLVVQTHLGHVYILTLILAVALVAGAVARRGSLTVSKLRRSRAIRLTLAGTFLAWLPSLIEQVGSGSDGNLSRLIRNVGGGDVSLGLRQAIAVTAKVLVAPWSRGWFGSAIADTPRTETADGPTIVVPELPGTLASLAIIGIVMGAAGVLLVWARRAGRPQLGAALLIALCAVPATVISLAALTVGPVGFGSHHVRWAFAVAIFVQVVVAWGAFEWVRLRASLGPRTLLLPAALVVVFAVANLTYFAQDLGPVTDRWARPTLNSVAAQLSGLELDDPVLFETDNLRPFEPFSGTVMMLLGEQRIDFRVHGDAWIRQLGERRAADGHERGALYQLEGAAALQYEGPDCVLARASSLGEEQAERMSAVAGELGDALYTGRIVPDAAVLSGDPRLDLLLSAIADADLSAVERLVLDGMLVDWAEIDALGTDSETTSRITADAGAIRDWVRTAYLLALRTDDTCPD